MARPPLPLGTPGTISVAEEEPGSWVARCRFRDHDGVTRRLRKHGSSKTAAKAARLSRHGHTDVRLLERRGHGVELTDTGKVFYLAHLRDRKQSPAMRAMHEEIVGAIRDGVPGHGHG